MLDCPPLHATAVGIIFAEILLVSDEALVGLPEKHHLLIEYDGDKPKRTYARKNQ